MELANQLRNNKGDEDNLSSSITLSRGQILLSFPRDLIPVYYATCLAGAYPISLIRHGDTVIDLGASFGDFSLLASKMVGLTGRVIAVEPHPSVFKFLVRNLEMNHIQNVVPIRAALGSGSSRKGFLVSDGSASKLSSTGTIEVPVVSLRDLLPRNSEAQVIKIDIEGAEDEVFESDIDLIAKARCVFVEAHTQQIGSKIESALHSRRFSVSTWNVRKLIMSAFTSFLVRPHEFVRAELRSRFYGLRAVASITNRRNPCDPRSGLHLIIATRIPI